MNARRAVLAAAALALSAGLVPGGPAPTTASAEAPTCAPARDSGGDWPSLGGDLGGTRDQSGEHFLGATQVATLEPAWTFDANRSSVHQGVAATNSEVTGYPVIADGCLYVGTSTGHQKAGWVFALDADSGEVVWRTRLSHGVYSTLAVADGRVYAFVSRIGGAPKGEGGGPQPWGPYVVALDQRTGAVLWQRTVDVQVGSDAVSSPVVHDGAVWVGVSGTAAEGDEGERLGFQGSFVLLDAVTGAVLRKTWTIPPEQWGKGFAGGAIWSTMSIDVGSGYGFVGTGNPFNYDAEHERTNAVLKVDLRKELAEGVANPAYGDVVDSYKGDVEQYNPVLVQGAKETCEESEELAVYAGALECGNLDLDFGTQPNLFEDGSGKLLVGAGQKSGVYHAIDPVTMDGAWTATVGVPSAVGGIVGTPAVDRYGIHGPHTLAGYLWSVEKDGGPPQWVAPLGDGVHWGNPVTTANGVAYTVDLKGFLSAYDAGTGAPLLQRPMALGAETWDEPTATWGGVSVARNTVYASVGVGLTSVGADPYPAMPNGFVIAFRPRALLD